MYLQERPKNRIVMKYFIAKLQVVYIFRKDCCNVSVLKVIFNAELWCKKSRFECYFVIDICQDRIHKTSSLLKRIQRRLSVKNMKIDIIKRKFP